jgi:divalent metal cation (Fe/Co/Zn/Cd) transporter
VQIVSGALVATCIVFLSSLSGEEPLDTWLTVALFAFAIAIPALAAEFIVATYRFIPQSQWEQWSTSSLLFTGRILADAIGQIGAFVGIIAFVGHFNVVAALVMALTIPAVLIIWSGGVIVEAVYDGTRNRMKNRQAKSAEQDAATARAGVGPLEQTRTDT